MKRSSFFIFIFLIMLCGAVSADQPRINQSGVWSIQGVDMTKTKMFSWGENPIDNDVTIIDLGAKQPYIIVSSVKFSVKSYTQEGYRFIFEGQWETGDEISIPGCLVVVYSEDSNSLYFESVKPEDFVDLGESHRLFKVPVDAPVVPIGPEGP
jgi:hypothetical protein